MSSPTEMRSRTSRVLLVALGLLAFGLSGGRALAEEQPDIGEISTKLNNPLGDLWMIFLENDSARYRGFPADGSQWVNTTLIQPVMPIKLTEDWNLITRPIIPFISAPVVEPSAPRFNQCPGNCSGGEYPPGLQPSASREYGWGDINVWSMLSPGDPPTLPDDSSLIWGLGPSFGLPTATEDQFGSDKWSFGPSGILLRLPNPSQKLTAGIFAQHLWGSRGSGDANVSQTQIQPIYWWKLPFGQWQVGGYPLININWKAKNDNKLTLPIELALANTFFVGKMPVRIGVGASVSLVTPDDYGQRWMLKFFFVPVIPSPFKKPLF